MTRPTKFEIMRHNRRCAERRRNWEAAYATVAALCANDAKARPVRRWWWPFQRVAAALSVVQLTKA